MRLLTFLLAYTLIQFVKPDCTEPPLLQNGTSSGCLSEGGRYQFSCDYSYTTTGHTIRLCLDGNWTGVQPTCELRTDSSLLSDVIFDSEYQIIPSFRETGGSYRLCWRELSLETASLICRQAGRGAAVSVHKADLDFGLEVEGPYFTFEGLACPENATQLNQCLVGQLNEATQCANGILGISCYPYSYLEYSTTLDRIQMYYDNEFVDVCSDAMEQTAVDNFCKIGGFIGGGVASSVGGTQVTNDTVRNVTCSKEMRSFSDCVVTLGDTCENGFLKISCLDTNVENSLRLTGAEDLHTGKLQIFKSGSWGDICWEAFYATEATVACKQLGFETFLAYPRGIYGNRVGDSYAVERVSCKEDGANFSSCQFLPESRCNDPDETVGIWCINRASCCLPTHNSTDLQTNSTGTVFTHGEVLRYSCAGNTVVSGPREITCQSGVWSGPAPICVPAIDNSVRLVDGNAQEGNIQIFLNDNWNYICDRNWELTTANSFCEMLGFEGAIALTKFNFYNSTQTGQPISFLECTPECVSQDCVVAEIAGVMCGDLQYEVRLVGSDLPTMGRAQIFYNGRWLEFCQDLSSFFLQNGPTICNQLGYGYERTFGSTEGREMFGVPDTNGTISALCFGTRSKVEDCSLSFFPCTNHGLYIACTPPADGSLRLVGGLLLSEGIVEIYQDYSWRSICVEGWDEDDGRVVCSQLGWESSEGVGEDYGPALSLSGFGITQVDCVGDESSILGCGYETDTDSCDRANPATVKCSVPVQYQARLVESTVYEYNTTGLVEVYVGKEWIGVCDDGWGLSDATVVCRSLGFDYTIAAITNYASIRTGEGWNYVNCVGNESILGDCSYRNTTVFSFLFADCSVTEGAGVRCGNYVPYSIRFRDNTLTSADVVSGTIEILHQGDWLPICYQGSDPSEYLCSQLGLGEPAASAAPGERITTTESFNNFPCTGNETIQECNPPVGDAAECASGNALQISCVNYDGRLRLVEGNETAGHVQVYHEGVWGDVCDDLWGIQDATVVCGQLFGRGALRAILFSNFGTRPANFLLDNVNCVGTEARLVDCKHNGWGQHNCGDYELAGVQCLPDDCTPLDAPAFGLITQDVSHGGFASFSCLDSYKLDGDNTVQCLWSQWSNSGPRCVTAVEGDIQLVDGPTSYEGHVQIFHDNEWGYVCDDGWDLEDGRVVCTQLGVAPNVKGISTSSFYTSGSNTSRIWLDGVNCVGEEALLTECDGVSFSDHDCNEVEYAGVECYANEGRLRLLGGDTEYDGLLQIYLDGTWNYFCNFEFIGGIQPACTQLGFQTTGSTLPTPVTAPASFKSAFCSFSDSSLYDDCMLGDVPNCLNNYAINLTCGINDRCEPRLFGEDYKGIVEFWRDGRWGGVCNGGLTSIEADILCRQLGWEQGAKSISFDVTEAGAIPFHFHNVSCSEGETDICECNLNANVGAKCTRDEAVYVECIVPLEGTLRLAGDEGPYTGVLEVFHEGVWGSVCDDAWGAFGSSVACKQLGTPGYISYSLRGTVVTRMFWLDNVVCTGEEEFLANCTHNGWGTHNCGGQEGVVLECDTYVENALQLTNITYSDDNLFARVRLNRGDDWYDLCPTNISDEFANQLCVHFNLEDSLNVSKSLVLEAPPDSAGVITLLSCPFEFDNYTECMSGESCPTDKVLGLRCRSLDNQTRLITNTGYSGIIEINHEGSWRGICDDGWGLNDATVACKQLGFRGAVRAISSLVRTEAQFWLTSVACGGYERYLDHCSFQSWDVPNCNRFEYAGVVCTADDCTALPTVPAGVFSGNLTHGSNIALQCDTGYVVRGSRTLVCVNGDWIGDTGSCNLPQEFSLRLVDTETDNFYKGHVQIYHLGKWGYVCDSGWDSLDGVTACIQLGFQGFQQITRQSYHGNVTGMSWADNVACKEGDRSFAECGILFNDSANCTSFAGVQCVTLEGHVQLINGSENGTGLVRIYKQGEYRAVCYDNFGPEEVSVVCRQLGYAKGVATSVENLFTTNSDLTLECDGTEGQVRDCVEFEVDTTNCRRFDVLINCSYEDQYTVRFVEGTTSYEGQLEVYTRDGWSSVCYGVDIITAGAVCNLLGWEYGANKSSAVDTTTELGINVNISSCPVHVEDLTQCDIDDTGVACDRHNALNIQCNLPAQNSLRRGHNDALEIFHNERWGYVCDDSFDSLDADVACRQLGYPNATDFRIRIEVLNDFFWLDNLNCNGNELSLDDCASNNFGLENCYAREGVVVECSPHYEGLIRFEGDIPLVFLDNAFHYLCSNLGAFSIHSASVVCRQIGRVEAESVSSFPVGTNGVTLQPDTKNIRCDGDENAVKECEILDEIKCVSIATIQCADPTGYIRLVGDTSSSGTIQIHNGTQWQYVCPDKWSYQDAEIACSELGFNVVREFGSEDIDKAVTYYASGFDCYGDEDRLVECINVRPPNCNVMKVATLSCRTLTCPILSVISSCVTCVPSCYGEVSPTNCGGCEEKCECLPRYIWNTTEGTVCIRESECPNFCGNNEVYECVPACQKNCGNYKYPPLDFCSSLSCTNGCGCKPGHVRRYGVAGECVLEADCEATTPSTQSTTPSVTTVTTPITPTVPPSCPDNSKYSNCSCPVNCSLADCIPECQSGCQCDTGYVWLLDNCIETDKCPADGSIEVQSSTAHTHTVSGPIHLFTHGGWYNVCSDGFDKETYLIELTCDYLNYTSTVESKYSTSQPVATGVSLMCPQGAESVALCGKELTECENILNLACVTPPAVAVPAVAGVAIGVVLGLLALLAFVIAALVMVAVMIIRKKNQKKVYKQFDARLSVVSDVTEPIDDPTGIANPIYQSKDIEAEQLISDDDDVLAS